MHYKTPHQSLKAKNNVKRMCLSENMYSTAPPIFSMVYTTQRDGSLQLEHSRGAGDFQPGSKIQDWASIVPPATRLSHTIGKFKSAIHTKYRCICSEGYSTWSVHLFPHFVGKKTAKKSVPTGSALHWPDLQLAIFVKMLCVHVHKCLLCGLIIKLS